MTPKAAAVLNVQHHAGMKADAAMRILAGLHDERHKQLTDALIKWFLNNDWNEQTAIRYIAALAENWAQKDELEQRSRKGAEAREKLFGAQTAGD